MTNKEYVDLILKDEGMTLDTFLDFYGVDSAVPGICTNEDCLFVVGSCEGDARRNWCPECEGQTVKSALILLELI